jgi:hypothetical protein
MKGMLRPDAIVLPDSALVPEKKPSPVPNQLTHETAGPVPYYLSDSDKPDGEFPANHKLALLSDDGGEWCQVVDSTGLRARVRFESLRKL